MQDVVGVADAVVDEVVGVGNPMPKRSKVAIRYCWISQSNAGSIEGSGSFIGVSVISSNGGELADTVVVVVFVVLAMHP